MLSQEHLACLHDESFDSEATKSLAGNFVANKFFIGDSEARNLASQKFHCRIFTREKFIKVKISSLVILWQDIRE